MFRKGGSQFSIDTHTAQLRSMIALSGFGLNFKNRKRAEPGQPSRILNPARDSDPGIMDLALTKLQSYREIKK